MSVDLSITHIFLKKKKIEFNMSVGLVRIFHNPPCSISEILKSCTNFLKKIEWWKGSQENLLNLLVPQLNSCKDVYSTDFLVYEE